MKNHFSENIKRLREVAKLTQKELAEKLGITPRKVSYWENGKIEPDMDTLILISNFFDESIDDLLNN